METMYDRLGELLSQTLEAGQVRFVSTRALQDAQEASGVQAGSVHAQTIHDSAQEEDALHSGAQAGSAHEEAGAHIRKEGSASSSRSGGSSLHDGSPQHRTRTQRRQGRPDGTAGVHTARSDQASFRPFASEPHTSSAQGSGSQAESYTFRQFTVPRVATMNEDEMRALRLLDLTDRATLEDVKRAYKEKLKYFHPDKYDKNEVLKTVATKKTRMIVDAYELLCKYFAPPSGDS